MTGSQHTYRQLSLMVIVAALLPSVALAVAQTYDDASVNGNVWDAGVTMNWDASAATWTNGNNALFSAVAGEVVEVEGTVRAVGLTSNYNAVSLTTGYTIADADNDGLMQLESSGGSTGTSKPMIAGTGTNTISVDILMSGTANNIGRNIVLGTSMTISGDISEADGSKRLNISGSAGILTLSGNNSFSGGLSLNNSNIRLNIGSATALGTGPLLIPNNTNPIDNVSGGALTLATNNAITISPVSGNTFDFTGSNPLNMGTGAVTLGTSNTNSQDINVMASTLTFGGPIGDGGASVGLDKEGAGTLILGGANTYTGNTTVAGTLNLLASSESRFRLQDGGASNWFTGGGSVLFNGIFRIDPAALTETEGAWSLVNVGTLTESFGATFGLKLLGSETLFTNNLDGTYSGGGWIFDTSTGVLTLVPEPASMALLVAGLALIGVRRRA